MPSSPTLAEVLNEARKLSPLDKLRLIERVASDLQEELGPSEEGTDEARIAERYRRAYGEAGDLEEDLLGWGDEGEEPED